MSALARFRTMSLRSRMALLTAGAVGVAVLAVSIGAWFLVRGELRRQVDAGLEQRLLSRGRGPGPGPFEIPARGPIGRGSVTFAPFGLDNAIQLIDASGEVVVPATDRQALPVGDRDVDVAAGRSEPYLRDVRVGGTHLRVLTVGIGGGRAVQMSRALTEVDGTLRGFALILAVMALVLIGPAAGVGILVARSALVPVERLTRAAEHVARTKELDARIDADRDDELGRLARSFNEMLGALEDSREQQRRLVADASHELRTPLTSLRTNIEVLHRQPEMGPEERERVLADVRSELEELSALVSELVELATEQRGADDEEIVDMRLDEVVTAAVERARRRTGREFGIDASDGEIRGRPLALERAVANLLDNACKWGPPDTEVDVTVRGPRVEVRDHGPGIAEEDRPHVFDRFYRATSARSMPGSGLGLSIVRQIVEAHGGRVWADDAPGGGAIVGFELPQDSQNSSQDS